ncbi:phage tail protein [Mycobacterium sp. PDNC021]|jgi:phage tail-like protein|uniref:phage tail protein n=1 Tax=Mycobacterium sp. PDNC021 TaxID=3391399 RepID=UPI0005BA47B9
MAETATREDPYRAYNFIVEIDSVAVAGFSEVGGLSGDGDVVEYREGTDLPLTVRKMPGLRKYANITLKRGYTTSRVLWQWRLNVINGNVERHNGAVVLLDEQRTRVAEWQFENAWVVKYEGPALNAKGNEVAVETLELAHEGLRLV